MSELLQQTAGMLVRVGFSPKESELYAAVMTAPDATTVTLGKMLSWPRTSVYDVARQLIVKGFLIELTDHRGGKRYRAESPERIVHILQLQEAELKGRIHAAEEMLPNLLALHGEMLRPFSTRYFSGARAFAQLRAEFAALRSDLWQIVGYDAFLAFNSAVPKDDHIATLTQNNRAVRSILLTDLPTESIYVPPGVECRILPSSLAPTSGELAVCGDRVALFSYDEGILAIDIQSPSIASACRASLQFAWKGAEELTKTFAQL